MLRSIFELFTIVNIYVFVQRELRGKGAEVSVLFFLNVDLFVKRIIKLMLL